MAGASTRAASKGLAEELRKALDALPYHPALPVRVVSRELADEVRKARAGSERV